MSKTGPAKTLVNDIKRDVRDVGKLASDVAKTARDTTNFKRMPAYKQSLKHQIEQFDRRNLRKPAQQNHRKRRMYSQGIGSLKRDNCFRRTDFVMDIVGNTSNNTPIINTLPIASNATQTLPWLAGIADNFETYRFKSIRFRFEPLASNVVSTGTLGQMVMAIDYNPAEPPPANIPLLCNKYKEKVRNPTRRFTLSYGDTKKFVPVPTKFVEHDNQNAAFNSYGNLYVAVLGTQSGVIGKLYVDYEICLAMPQLPNSNHMQVYSNSITGVTIPATSQIDMLGALFTSGSDPSTQIWVVPQSTGPNYATLADAGASGLNGTFLFFNIPGFYHVTAIVNVTMTSGSITSSAVNAAGTNSCQFIPASSYGDKSPMASALPEMVVATPVILSTWNFYVDAWTSFVQPNGVINGATVGNNTGSYVTFDSSGYSQWYFVSSAGGVATLSYTLYIQKMNSVGILTQPTQNVEVVRFDQKYTKFLLKHNILCSIENLNKIQSYFEKLSLFESPNEKDILAIFSFDKDSCNNNNNDVRVVNTTPCDDNISVVDMYCRCNKLDCVVCVAHNQHAILKQLHAKIVI